MAIDHKTVWLLHYLVGTDDPLNDLASRDNAAEERKITGPIEDSNAAKLD